MCMLQLAGNIWAGQYSYLTPLDWCTIHGEPDLEVMQLTEDAIPLRHCRVDCASRPGGSGNSGDEEEGETAQG
jgi:hypothetical protein